MHAGTYGLGVDVGDQTVVAAVRRDGGGPAEALDLGGDAPLGSAAVRLAGGGLSVLPPRGLDADDGLVEHVLERVGAPTPLTGPGGSVRAADAVAAIVLRAHTLAASRQGAPAAWTVLTVPPSWSGHRRELLARALTAAGLPRSSVVSSAVAVVRAQVAAGALSAGSTVAVYDLGASSLDTAVVRTTEDGRVEHLAAPPAPLGWGGRDLDDAVLAHVLGSVADAAAPADRREGVAVRRACVAAKESLSTETDVRVDLVLGGAAHSVRVVREDVEDLVAEAVEASVDLLRSTVEAAGTTVDELAAVVLAGGSARVPLVAETLSAELGRPLVTGPEPARSAASGAAQLAVDRLHLDALRAGLLRTRPASHPAPAPAPAPAAAPIMEAGPAEDTAVLPAGSGPGGRRTLARRPRRAAASVGALAHVTRRQLQRAAVLTTAVLGLWAGSASLVAVIDPAGVDSPAGGASADADEPTARDEPGPSTDGDPLTDAGPGGTTPVELTPAAAERFRADEPEQDDGGPPTRATQESRSGATGRVATTKAPGTPAALGRTAPGTPADGAGTGAAGTPVEVAPTPDGVPGGLPVTPPVLTPVPGPEVQPTPEPTPAPQPVPAPTTPDPVQVPEDPAQPSDPAAAGQDQTSQGQTSQGQAGQDGAGQGGAGQGGAGDEPGGQGA